MPVCTPVDAYETTLCATGRFRRPAHMITHARPAKEPVEYELDTDDACANGFVKYPQTHLHSLQPRSP